MKNGQLLNLHLSPRLGGRETGQRCKANSREAEEGERVKGQSVLQSFPNTLAGSEQPGESN